MGRPGESEYDCPECGGEGTTSCERCGALETCCHCRGSKFDPGKVDISAFRVAEKALLLRMSKATYLCRIDPETGEPWKRVVVTDYLLDQ